MALPIVHHPAYHADGLDPNHRFPMAKFRLLAEALVAEGVVDRDGLAEPGLAPPSWLRLAHDPVYVDGVLNHSLDRAAVRRIGFPLIPSVSRRARAAVGGTCLAARLALEHGRAGNTAGGSHHADYARGAGFCVFNDVAVAAQVLLAEGAVSRILIIDLDVHQGDGTARIFADDPRVLTCSLHCQDNWPTRKAQSDVDVGLPAGTGDAAYLSALAALLDKAFAALHPDLVFYNAGVDVHHADRLGKLALTDAGLKARDHTVVEACARYRVPIVGVLGGGYGHSPEEVARRHVSLFQALATGV
ncbi:MAG: histone deacetylase [Maricaulaceae bacterium]